MHLYRLGELNLISLTDISPICVRVNESLYSQLDLFLNHQQETAFLIRLITRLSTDATRNGVGHLSTHLNYE